MAAARSGPVDFLIRPAVRSDLPALAQLWFEFETWLNAIADPEPVDPAKFERFEALAFGPDALCTVLLAELEGKPVGYLVYYHGVWMDDMAPCVHVADLFVRPVAHRQGIGRALMERVRTIARDHGAAHAFWTVWRKNRAARDFYRRIGAEPFDDEVLMIWDVA
jgi:GNAT superfamily N-acetyltransferase